MKKRGFTLIELLAVIVILAIIALIATPIILGVVEDARKSAARSAAYGYLDAVAKQIVLHDVDSTTYASSVTITGDSLTDSDIPVQGEQPTKVTIGYKDGKWGDGSIEINGYTVTFEDGKATSVSKGTTSSAASSASSDSSDGSD